MNVPAIGGAKGIFDIFVPGAFLLLNLTAIAYQFPMVDEQTKTAILKTALRPAISAPVLICFGYLFGVVLRLLACRNADDLSVAYLRRFDKRAKAALKETGEYPLWLTEDFPYVGWMGQLCDEHFPEDAARFYQSRWGWQKRTKRKSRNHSFFNFEKTLLTTGESAFAGEVYAAESLSRYIASSFYSLLIASVLLFVSIVVHLIVNRSVLILLPLVLLIYLLAITAILRYFRFIRIKEVETVFAAAYKAELTRRERLQTA